MASPARKAVSAVQIKKKHLAALAAIVVLSVAVAILAVSFSGRRVPGAGAFAPARQTKTTGCAARGALPDPACTPGAVLDVTAEQVCRRGYSKSVRHVPAKLKEQVFKE